MNRDPRVPFRVIRVSSPTSRIEIHGKTTSSIPTIQSETTRRSTLAAGAAIASAVAAALAPASPAQAFLGFGGASKDDQYATDTVRNYK